MKKYLVYPGWVRSCSDGQMHWISARMLMSLYRVNPNECLTLVDNGPGQPIDDEHLLPLVPRQDGNYELPA